MKVIIMAGGKGTRFWPRSTEATPKQFLRLTSDETMLQVTYNRFAEWLPVDSIYVVTAKLYEDKVLEQLPHLSGDRLIIEPEQRDTGPCTALTALHFLWRKDDEILVFTPSDQYISDAQALWQALLEAEKAAYMGRAVATIGIVPSRPETGYGYIETMEEETESLLKVKRFIEKPNEIEARSLIQRPNVFWNSGIFVWKPSTIEYYMKKHQPELWEPLVRTKGQEDAIKIIYPSLPRISVDYAIIEKAENILMRPVQFIWDDVGNWTSLERIRLVDDKSNMLQGDIHAYWTENSILYTENQKIVVIGVQDLIIVSTDEGMLICHKTREQDIKKVLQVIQNDRNLIEGES
ncbi:MULTISPECIES: mannose-1-phosphate guanylyltransferase [unclassified Paenibacillus]|uniref:mannose-1-phosphate guanylyltransferase n=1 Tax=unclassified Paenibacillus TaxID=185978 RepID=UPI0036380A75